MIKSQSRKLYAALVALLSLIVALAMLAGNALAAHAYEIGLYETTTAEGAEPVLKATVGDDGLALVTEEGLVSGQYFKRDSWNVVTTTKFVPVISLLDLNGITLEDGDSITVEAPDGFSNTLPASYVLNGKFYPNNGATGYETKGAVSTKPVLALQFASAAPAEGETLGDVQTALTGKQEAGDQVPRFICGIPEGEFNADGNTAGRRFVSGVSKITVTKPEGASTPVDASEATVDPIEDQVYTGEAIEPALTVKLGETTLIEDTDYTVTYSNNTEVGTATFKVEFTGDYTGEVSGEFKIVSDEESPDDPTPVEPKYDTQVVGDKKIQANLDAVLEVVKKQHADAHTITIELETGNFDVDDLANIADFGAKIGEDDYLPIDAFTADLFKVVDGVKTDIGSDNEALVEMVVPYDAQKYPGDQIRVYTLHNGKVKVLTTQPNELGEYIKINDNGTISVFAKEFSTFAIAYKASGAGISGKATTGNAPQNGKAVTGNGMPKTSDVNVALVGAIGALGFGIALYGIRRYIKN